MESESDCSALESVEDNEVNPETIPPVDNNKIGNNGYHASETDKLSSGQSVDANGLLDDKHEKGVEATQTEREVSPPGLKGYGLKKWRRIKRDFVKDTTTSGDNSKILKRGLSGSANPPAKATSMNSIEAQQNSESSVGSVNIPRHASSPDSRFAGIAFAAGPESENSEDQSSKLSTAASAPKIRHDLPNVLGHVRDKNKGKSLGGKIGGNSAQQLQKGKGRVDNSKKARGEKVKTTTENSHSSLESDSRSSNFVFLQDGFSMATKGKQNGKSMDDDGENSHEVDAREQQFSEEVETAYRKVSHEEEGDYLSQDDLAADSHWEVKEEKSENHHNATDHDPLLGSIDSLRSVQEALEKELQKFVEMGKESISLHENAVKDSTECADSTFNESRMYGCETIHQGSSSCVEAQGSSFTQNVKFLERELEKTRATVEVKESKIDKLESSLINKEMEAELEELFQKKVEAEIEYLTLKSTVENLRAAAGDQVMLLEVQQSLAVKQVEMLSRFGEAENKAEIIKQHVEELESSCGVIVEGAEETKIQRRICKYTSCFFIQLILLVLVVWLFIVKLSPPSGVVVPT